MAFKPLPTLIQLKECRGELIALINQEGKPGQEDCIELRAIRSALKVIDELIEENQEEQARQ
jgi:hypothetical protein